MTWLEIYNAVCMRIWGVQAPPEGAVAFLQGPYGVIGEVHRKIQKGWDFGFMEVTETIAVIGGTAEYDLPANLKGIIKGGVTWDIITEASVSLRMLLSGQHVYFDGTEESEYPGYYEIFGNQIIIYPTPTLNLTLNIRCFRYLPRPPAVFAGTSDAFTIMAPDVIYNFAAAEVLIAQEEYQKASMYEARGTSALDMIKEEDSKLRRPEVEISCVNE